MGAAAEWIPLTAYALRERVGYNVALGRVLRGEVPGKKNDGRWYVEIRTVSNPGDAGDPHEQQKEHETYARDDGHPRPPSRAS
jgi:hypothetical protein